MIRRGPLAALPLLVFVAAVTAGDIRRLPSGRAGSTARYAHTLSWTGSEVIVVAGRSGESPGARSIYFGGALAWSPQADTWRELSTYRAPSPRAWHSSVWTGTHLIVWGGQNAEEELGDGVAWNAARDSWRELPMRGAPAARIEHTAVWTGTEMLVWGGLTERYTVADGFAYDPERRRWRAIATQDAPSARRAHHAVWTGREMIVWGGIDGSRRLDTGARYDPHADTWTPLPTAGAPEGGGYPAVAWTGTHLLVWSRGTGATWDPETNAWSPIASEPLFGVRKGFAFAWSGSKLLLWGGEIVDGPTGEAAVPGAVYTHETNTWRTLERNPGNAGAPWPVGRLGAKLVWTDRTAFLMGGYSYLGPARTIACGGAWSIDVTPPVVTPR